MKELHYQTGSTKQFFVDETKTPALFYLKVNPNDNYSEWIFECNYQLLCEAGVGVPKYRGFDQATHLLKMDYLGNTTMERLLPRTDPIEKKKLIEKMIQIAAKIRSIKGPLPRVSIENLLRGYKKNFRLDNSLEKILADCSQDQFSTLHGDFNSTNLIFFENNIYVIDFMGMCKGPSLLDIISILNDRATGLTIEDAQGRIKDCFRINNSAIERQELLSYLSKIGTMKELSLQSVTTDYFNGLYNYYLKRFKEYCEIRGKKNWFEWSGLNGV